MAAVRQIANRLSVRCTSYRLALRRRERTRWYLAIVIRIDAGARVEITQGLQLWRLLRTERVLAPAVLLRPLPHSRACEVARLFINDGCLRGCDF